MPFATQSTWPRTLECQVTRTLCACQGSNALSGQVSQGRYAMVQSFWSRWNLRKQCGLGMYTEQEGNVVASELPRSVRSNRLHKHSTRQIIKDRDPGRVVLVRTEADKEPPLDAKSIITFMKIYQPTRKSRSGRGNGLALGSSRQFEMERKRGKIHRDVAGTVEVNWDGPRPLQQAVAADLALTHRATRLSR